MGIQERKERERKMRLNQIREAGLKVFSSKGYEAATMDEVATQAELSKALLYYYYPSKRQLYREVVLHYTSLFYNQAWKVAEKAVNLQDLISSLLDFHISYFSQRMEQLRLIFLGHFLSEDEDMGEVLRKVRKPLEDKFSSLSPAPWVFDLFWTYIIGISLKMLRKIPMDKIITEKEAFKKMIKGEIR